MSETPRTGDRVRVILDGIFIEDDTGRCLELADRETVGIPDAATVEVLERADDPSTELAGSVRISRAGARYVKVDAREGVDPWIYLTGGSGVDTQFPRMDDRAVGGWLRGEPVPDSPAAEAQTLIAEWEPRPRLSVRVPNEPHGIRNEDRYLIAGYLKAGDLERAVTAAFNFGAPTREAARSYVEEMSEYQTYRNRSEPRRVIMLENAAPEWEPDTEVRVWEWMGTPHNGFRFLHRIGGGYLWDKKSEPMEYADASPNTWYGATKNCLGEYREVWS